MADPGHEPHEFDDLLEEFLARARRGESPSVAAYAERCPHAADAIRELFPAALAMEGLKEMPPPGPPASLQRLGDFRIIREIGRGGMGVVYEAEQESLGRRVAVKVLLNQALQDATQTSRFEREARLAASLHHTHIVTVHGVGEQDGTRYCVMELIAGIPLDRVVSCLAGRATDGAEEVAVHFRGHSERDRWRIAGQLGLDLAEALQHAHEQGVLHRDIKPGNVLVDAHGGVWIADFGLAKALHADDLTQTGAAVGTLRYMAPEQLAGKTGVASDLYALGLLLYELLALKPAYPETDRAQLIRRIAHGTVPAPRESVPALPLDLDTIIRRLTAPEPRHRYPTAAALAEDLRRFVDGRPITARPVGWPVHLWRWARRRPALAGLNAAVVALGLATVCAIATGWVRTQAALAREKRQLERAEANASLAVGVLDRMFGRFAPSMGGMDTAIRAADGETLSLPGTPVLSAGAAALLEELLPLYDRLATEAGNAPEVRERAAVAHARIGDVRWQLGQYAQAETAYRQSLAAYAALGGANPRALERARVQNRLGQLLKDLDRSEESRQAHQAALAILTSAPPALRPLRDLRLEVARTLFCLGCNPGQKPPMGQGGTSRESARRRRSREQNEHLGAAIDELHAVLRDAPGDSDCLFLLALCQRERPRRSRQEEPASTPVGQEAAIRILSQLTADHPSAAEYRFELAQTYAQGNLRQWNDGEEARQAEERLRQSLVLLDWLVRRHPYVSRYAMARAMVCHKLSAICRQAERWDEAENQCRQAVDELLLLSEQNPEVGTYAVWLAAYRNGLADLLVRRGRIAEARSLLDANLGCLRAVPDDIGTGPFVAQLRQQAERILDKCRNPKAGSRPGNLHP